MNDRAGQLIKFLEEDPNDEFVRYALALEYLKFDIAKAEKEFENLLKIHPDYLPTYYPAAHLMIELGNAERAELLFNKGIDIAKKQNNRKAQMELQSAYTVWQIERD